MVFFSNSSLLSTGRSKVDLNKYLISLRIVHLWWGVKWHNANLSNNRNGILNIQSTVSLKCKLPWSCPEQTSGEEGDMTVCTTPQTPPTHTHTLSFSPYTHTCSPTTKNNSSGFAPASDSSGHSCGKVQRGTRRQEGKAERNEENMRIKCGRNLGKKY